MDTLHATKRDFTRTVKTILETTTSARAKLLEAVGKSHLTVASAGDLCKDVEVVQGKRTSCCIWKQTKITTQFHSEASLLAFLLIFRPTTYTQKGLHKLDLTIPSKLKHSFLYSILYHRFMKSKIHCRIQVFQNHLIYLAYIRLFHST